MTALDAWIADVSQSSYGWPDSLRFTYDKTRDLLAAGVPGDLVECGVGNGVHPAAMAKACIDAGETRTIRLFDSFQSVPHGRADRDVEWSRHYGDGSGTLAPTGVASCAERILNAYCALFGHGRRYGAYRDICGRCGTLGGTVIISWVRFLCWLFDHKWKPCQGGLSKSVWDACSGSVCSRCGAHTP